MTPLSTDVLPAGIRSRFVHNINGITMHVLEAGYETPGRPAVLMLHGFPELAYSWRKVMLPLAAQGTGFSRSSPNRSVRPSSSFCKKIGLSHELAVVHECRRH